MQAEDEAAGGDGVGELALGLDVALGEDDIAHEAPGLAPGGDGVDALEVGLFRSLGELALDVGEVPVDGPQEVVADAFGLGDHVPPVPVLPRVVAVHLDVVLCDLGGPGDVGEVGRLGHVVEGEVERACVGHLVGLLGREVLVEFALALAAHAEVGARPVANRSVAGAVDEDGRAEADFLVGARVAGVDGGDALALLLHTEGVPAEVEVEGFLGGHYLLTGLVGDDLVDDGSAETHGPDVYLGAGVAAEDRAVLDQGHAQAKPRCRQRRRAPRDPAAYYHRVVLARQGRSLRKAEQPLPPGGHALARLIGRRVPVCAQEDGVTAAVPARQVLELERDSARLQLDRPAILPGPRPPARAKLRRQWLAIDQHAEAAGVVFGDPVVRPHPNTVRTGPWDLDLGAGVVDRMPEAVGHEVR